MKTTKSIDRNTFLRQCGAVCLGTSALSSVLTGCVSVYYAQAPKIKGWAIQISRKEFEIADNPNHLRPYLLVEMKNQTYPIYLRRVDDDRFTAVLMQCTHQGNTLNAHDNFLSCPAHGSEYDTDGKVTEGPAEYSLTSYKVTVDDQHIYINIA